jgi:hypothetical protein
VDGHEIEPRGPGNAGPQKKLEAGVKPMASVHRLNILLLAAILIMAAGCGNAKIEQVKSELEGTRKEVQSLRAENARFMGQLSRLQAENIDLQISLELLATREAQLAQWSRQLVERFGPAVWFFGPDDKPLPHRSMQNATPQSLIQALNDLFRASDLPQIALIKIEDHTAFVHIRGDEQLTQAMGSAGANGYIQAVTFTLCSLAQITSVDIDFKEGDHAVPGLYSR